MNEINSLKMDFKAFLDELYECRFIDAKLIRGFVNSKSITKHYNIAIKKVKPDVTECIDDFIQHKLCYDDLLVKGCQAHINKTIEYPKTTHLIVSLFKVYKEDKHIPTHYFYSLLCVILYNDADIYMFMKTLGTTKVELDVYKLNHVNIASKVNNIISNLQSLYSTTENKKYLYIISMILRGQSSIYRKLNKKIEFIQDTVCVIPDLEKPAYNLIDNLFYINSTSNCHILTKTEVKISHIIHTSKSKNE